MIYGGPGLSLRRMIWLLAHPSRSPVSKLSPFLSLTECRRSRLLTGEWWGGGGRGAKSYYGEKALPSINHPIFYGLDPGAKSHDGEKAWPSINHSILHGLDRQGRLYASLSECVPRWTCSSFSRSKTTDQLIDQLVVLFEYRQIVL
jgi:hypothetical protein